MRRPYKAPALELHGSLTALTSSVKCTPGIDAFGNRAGKQGIDYDIDIPQGKVIIHNPNCFKL